jgi:hypothetical protein
MFVWYQCSGGVTLVLFMTILVVFLYVAAFVKLCGKDCFRENFTPFVCAWSSAYLLYLTWSALASVPTTMCNPYFDTVGNTIAQVVVGSVFTSVTLGMMATSSTSSTDAEIEGGTTTLGQAISEKVDDAEITKEN